MEAENCKLAFYGGRDLNTVFRECFFSEGNKICLNDDGEDYDLANLDPNSRLHQYRNFNKIPSDASMRLDSLSPTFSDIFCYESDEDGDKNSNTQTLKLMIEDTFKSIPSIPSLWQPTVFRADKANVSSIDLSDCEDDRLANLDTNSRQYRYKMVEKIPSDAKSMRLYSTSASTKAPSVIKDKIKRNLDLSKKKEIRKRCALKENRGGRKENRNTCKEYAEWAYDSSSAIDSHALCLISKNKPTRYNEGVHLNEFPTVTGNCMMFVNEATGFITQMQHGVSLGCSLFVTSEECAIPFLENFYEIHDWVEEKYEKKILAVIDTQNILSNQRIMDILRHRTVLNDLPLTLILQSNIDWIDIWSAFPYSSYYQIYNRFFLGNFSLQYEKPVIPKITDLNGIDVFGAFINYPPYSAYIHVAPGTGNAHLFNSHEKFSIQLEGQEHTLLVEFCIKYNCTLTARLEYDDELWGASYPNHTGSGLVGALIMRDANVSCAAIYLWDDTNVFTQYSAIIQKATVTLIVPQPLPLPYWETPILPFPAFIWGYVIGAFLIGALTLSVVNATKTKLNRQNKQEERGLFDSIYAVFMISIFQGVSISIKLLTDMVIYTVILMYALVIGNLYLSGLASVMTITRFEEPVDSVQKLVDSEFIWGGTTLNWIFDIRESEDPVFQRFTAEFNVKSPMEVQKLVQQRKMAVTVEILQHGTLSYQPFIDKEGSKYYMMMKDPLYSQLTVIMTSKTWPFMEQLNRIAYMQQESGIRYYWELKAAYKTTDYDIQRNMDKNGKPSEGEGAVKLSIQHILGALFFLAFGTITASIFFLLELLFFSKKKKFTIKERTFLVGSGK